MMIPSLMLTKDQIPTSALLLDLDVARRQRGEHIWPVMDRQSGRWAHPPWRGRSANATWWRSPSTAWSASEFSGCQESCARGWAYSLVACIVGAVVVSMVVLCFAGVSSRYHTSNPV